MSDQRSYWLLVERLANWERDCANGFRQFGIPSNKKGLAGRIRRGDFLIFYVSSGVSAFADVREAETDGVRPMPRDDNYDIHFPWMILSRPILTVARDKWVHIGTLAAKLSITAGMKHWRNAVRSSLNRLDPRDANLILESMQQASSVVEATPLWTPGPRVAS
jgi:hypothetical protein